MSAVLGRRRARIAHVYDPRGAAKELFGCRADEVLLSGPAGTGKSRAALEKLHLMMLVNPGARGLIVRKTLASLGSTALETWRSKVATVALEAGDVVYYGGSSEEPPQYRYTNGSAIFIGGMDKPSKIMSSDYDVIFVQESTELTVTDWESLTTRLRNGVISFQQLIADCNPSAPTHWLKKRSDDGSTVMLHSKHIDNPRLYTEAGTPTREGRAYLGKLDKLTGVRKLRLRDGLWVAAEGVIFEEFSDVHMLDRFPIPADWRRYWVVDFGYKNPFLLQCWAEDHDGRLYLYREIYHTGRLVEDHARKILSVVAPGGTWIEPKPQKIICDHDAEDRATLKKHLGMGTHAADKRVKVGLEATQARFRVQEDGKPRVFFLRDSLVERDESLREAGKPTCTEEEIPSYIWEPAKDGKPAKEEPHKEDDHGCDGLRYMVAEKDLKRRIVADREVWVS